MSHAAPCLQAGARARGSLKAHRDHASCTASFGSLRRRWLWLR